MRKIPNKTLKLLVVAGILFSVALLCAGRIFAAGEQVSGPEKEWADKAWQAINEGKYDEALTYANKAIQINSDYARAYNMRGLALFNKDEPGLSKKAIEDYDMAIKLNPASPGYYQNRGNAQRSLGLYDADIEDQNRALKLNPNSANAYENRGAAYFDKKQYDLAIKDYTRSLELRTKEEDKVKSYYDRALAYEAKGLVNEALSDLRKAVGLDPSNRAFKQELAELENAVEEAQTEARSTGSPQYAGGAQPSEAESSSQPATSVTTAAAPSGAGRVLAPFSGYTLANSCKQGQTMNPGTPWRLDAAQNDGPVGAKELGQYQVLLRHTMQGLRLFYGPMSQEEEMTFNAFWAPYFDHPIKASLEYFKQITLLLDELAVTMNNLDGMLSSLGVGLQEVLLVAGDPTSSAGRMASVEYQSVKAQRAKVDDLVKRIEALGNPPNPLAAKCAARKRHHKAMAIEGKEKEENILDALKKTCFFERVVYYQSKTIANGFTIKEGIGKYSEGEWEWEGNAFTFNEQFKNYDSPDNQGAIYRWENSGTISQDGKTIEKFTFKRFTKVRTDEFKDLEAIVFRKPPTIKIDGPTLKREVTLANIPLVSAEIRPDFIEIVYGVKGPSVKQHIVSVYASNTGTIFEPNEEEEALPASNAGVAAHLYSYPPNGAGEILIKFRLPTPPDVRVDYGAGSIRRAYWKVVPEQERVYYESTKASWQEQPQPGGQEQPQKQKEVSEETSPEENDPQLIKEAISQHMALAEQARRDADRWAADAKAEKNDDRRQELERRAAGSFANAQSEKDIAESLRTGTIIHTPTEWDERQHQELVKSVNKELTVFSIENKLLDNIPKVGDMVAGIEGVQLREQMQQRIDDAIKSPDRLQKLAGIYADLQNKVINQGEQQMAAEQAKVQMWDKRIAIAENVQFAAATGIMLGGLWAPAEIGSLAIGYAGAAGFAEDGVKGAAVAVTRSVSSRADVIISAYEGAIKKDPATGEPAGAWGAIEGALWSIGTNKAFEKAGARIQKFKAGAALASQGAGGAGFKPVAKAKGEAGIKEYDFKTPEHRYQAELNAAATPQQKAAVSEKYAIQAEREKMNLEKEGARQKAENDIHRGLDPAKVKENYNKDLNAINEKYKDTTRNKEHEEVLKKLGFNAKEDITLTGSAPKNAASDMDFTPQGKTPHEAYQKGKAYVEAMKKRGHSVDEYGDRWVDNTTDSTVWKPGFGADKPGSSSFDAEVIFGTMPHSDKFGTKGGIEWTSSEAHVTDDPLGAVLANAGKAAGAGLGNPHPKDLHTIGKSAAKAAEAAGIEVDPQLKAQIEALKAHQTPEQAGIVELGADQATKDKQVNTFLAKVEALMGRAYNSAKAKSEQKAKELQPDPADNSDAAYNIRSKLAAYRAGNNAALTTIAQASSGLGKVMAPKIRASDIAPEIYAGDKSILNLGGLSRELFGDRDDAAKAPPLPADPNDPAFAGLSKRCKEAAKRTEDKIKAAKPGSEEQRYLTELKSALEQGEKNPAEAVRNVRGISGQELAVVLAQLGVPANSK